MIYLFEDDFNSPLSKLFRLSYPTNIQDSFKYANGNQNLHSKVQEYLDGGENVIVFMDIIPNNKATFTIYDDLLALGAAYGVGRLFVVPTVCSEYYLIKSLSGTSLVTHPDSVDLCLDIRPYMEDDLIQTTEDRRNCRTFERYCKFLLNHAFQRCVHSAKVKGVKSLYVSSDCPCILAKHYTYCPILTLKNKSIEFLINYPAVPSGLFEDDKCQKIKSFIALEDKLNSYVEMLRQKAMLFE